MQHIPVLLSESIAGLGLDSGADCVDGTAGAGGHAAAILAATSPSGRLLALDADPEAVERVAALLAKYGDRAVVVQANFAAMATVAADEGFAQVQGILLDLGVSSFQLGEEQRGFSFLAEGPLDMRLDPGGELTAGEIVNSWGAEEIAGVIYRYGEETASRRIARAIVAARPLQSTTQLAEVVARAMGGGRAAGGRRTQRIHPATRVFQALRIQVNDELGALQRGLEDGVGLLRPGGRFAVITFHSLEDRIVKQFFQRESRDCICPSDLPVCRCEHHASLRTITRHPILPTAEEIQRNPRARSAKLRIAERLHR